MTANANANANANDNDLLGVLAAAHKAELQAEHERGKVNHEWLQEHLHHVADFVKWARARLRKVPVVGTYPVAQGLGLRFQDGSGAPFTPQPPDRPMRDEAIHVTNPGFNPATDLVASPECMPITGRH